MHGRQSTPCFRGTAKETLSFTVQWRADLGGFFGFGWTTSRLLSLCETAVCNAKLV